MTDVFDELKRLQLRNTELEETIKDLRAEKKGLEREIRGDAHVRIGSHFGMTPQESALFAALLSRPDRITHKALLFEMLYEDNERMFSHQRRPADSDGVQAKIFDVLICKVRSKLKPYGIGIETSWGRGWWMTKKMVDRTMAFVDKKGESHAKGSDSPSTAPADTRICEDA